jgi:hypothetical protein
MVAQNIALSLLLFEAQLLKYIESNGLFTALDAIHL